MSELNEKTRISGSISSPLYILAPFVPTPHEIVDAMLRLADVTRDDIVYDLGCGDGRIVIATAQKYGAHGVGVDIEPYWVEQSQANARDAGVEHLVDFRQQDAMTMDVSEATVVMCYLVEWSIQKIQPVIAGTAKVGTRIVSHNFGLADWPPLRREKLTGDQGDTHTLYLWIAGS